MRQLAIVDKRRERPGESEVMNVIGDVAGKDCLLIDDIVDSGGTLCNAADALLENGATSVTAYITHGVLSGGAVARITGSKLQELVITDSIQPTQAVARRPQYPRRLDRRPDRRGDLPHRDRRVGVQPVRLTAAAPNLALAPELRYRAATRVDTLGGNAGRPLFLKKRLSTFSAPARFGIGG